ncbi:hypothetical protein CLOLEP_02983 [[Clostridium] leptum DSM 753]|uniref:Uncharacterized protein n=1 Tax=[Clostridium] leptum DSM 753 TaxID=428125 RepID=A7VWL8_9FIRM|nr:hypothetical protein CLOLEP_02983 [[Clostridium] leptum DSM 753]
MNTKYLLLYLVINTQYFQKKYEKIQKSVRGFSVASA